MDDNDDAGEMELGDDWAGSSKSLSEDFPGEGLAQDLGLELVRLTGRQLGAESLFDDLFAAKDVEAGEDETEGEDEEDSHEEGMGSE